MKFVAKVILILLIILSVILTAISCVGAYLIYHYRDSSIDSELMQSNPNTPRTELYYFEHSKKSLSNHISPKPLEGAYLNSGAFYKYTPLCDMPDHLINAFIAIEDKRFMEHNGVDLPRSAKAAVNYLTGGERMGGSTITQQLVKNLTGRDEATVDRKLREGFAAMHIESEYEKDEILEQYLNVINLARGCRGVGAAAELYYSKPPCELTLSECATIAAITNNPSRYDPISHPENNMARRDLILKCMKDQGFIGEQAYNEAINQPISLNASNGNSQKYNSWYTDMVVSDVIDDLCAKNGLSPSAASLMLYRGGYKIYTAIDPDIQEILEEYYRNEYNFPIDSEGKTAQSAMIVIDPYSGDILGVVGAIGNKMGNRLQSFATDTKRPSGSTIKPLSVYAPALDRGLIEWSDEFDDAPTDFIGEEKRPWPQNVDRNYVGRVDVKYALEHSLNTVPVTILKMIGEKESMTFLRNTLRLTSLDGQADSGAASLALGQPTRGVTLRELTAAYSIFEEGIMSQPRSYYKVTDSDGRIILDNQPSQEAVISRESAAIMTKMLQSVVETGTAAGKINLLNSIEVAGKSGTSGNNCDRLFIGYTPELLAGVWFGYEYPKSLSDFGGNLSVYIWDEVMEKIYQNTDRYKRTAFTVPETVQKLSYPAVSEAVDPKETTYDTGWFNVKNHKSQ